jgi:hypothetical protein
MVKMVPDTIFPNSAGSDVLFNSERLNIQQQSKAVGCNNLRFAALTGC